MRISMTGDSLSVYMNNVFPKFVSLFVSVNKN